MNASLRDSDERREVAAAAEAWQAAGAIGEAELAAIRARYPDDRRRSRSGFRLLFFVFTVAAGLAAWVFLLAMFDRRLFGGGDGGSHAVLLAVLATLTALGAEAAIRAYRLRGHGVEEGLVALALGWGCGAAGLLWYLVPLRDRPLVVAAAASCALFVGAAAWRWGVPLTGGVAAAALFVALRALPGGRAWWIGAGTALAVASALGSVSPRVAPAHRRRLDEVFVVAVAAFYAAVHVAGLESDWLGWATRRTQPAGEVAALTRTLAWLAMTVWPIVLVVIGLRRRDRLALALGCLLTLVTAASAADVLDFGPGWLVFGIAGALLLALSLALRRRLARRPGRTACGFTDLSLYEPADRRGSLEIAATLAALSPTPHGPAPPADFEPGDGGFGGGGASGEF